VIRWVESTDGAPGDLYVKIHSPTLTGDDTVGDLMLDEGVAEELPECLRRYEYTSRPHVVIALMWHTMMRVGPIRSLDVSEFDSEEGSPEVVYWPEGGTTTKNGTGGEGLIPLSDLVCQLLEDWIEQTFLNECLRCNRISIPREGMEQRREHLDDL
jgi:integrase